MKVLTQNGFKSFNGIINQGVSNLLLKITFSDGSILECTHDHELLIEDKFMPACFLCEGDILSEKEIENIEEIENEVVYDLYNVEETHSYITNGVVSHNCNLIYLDEFAFVKNAEEFYTSTYPVVTAGTTTKIIITSTANGIGNRYHKIWTGAVQGVNEFKPFRVDWWDVPGRDEDWKNQQIRNTSERQFAQEFANTFYGTGDTLIDGMVLSDLRADKPIETREKESLRVYKHPQQHHEYVLIADCAKGRGQDYSAFSIIDVSVDPFEQVVSYSDNTISPYLYPNIIEKYAKIYNNALAVIEANDVGHLVAKGLYHDLEYENTYIESAIKADKIGIETTKKVKRIGCSSIKDIIEEGKLLIWDKYTIQELNTFEKTGYGYEASKGNHDDLVMTLVLFGFFANSQDFEELADINLRQLLYEERMRDIEEDLPAFGFIDDGLDDAELDEFMERYEPQFREIDLTGSGPGEDTTSAVIAGNFNWGPVYTPTLIANESRLVDTFGSPDTSNNIDFISAALYFSYSNSLYVIRGLEDSDGATSAVNAYSISNPTDTTPLIKNENHYDLQASTLSSFTGDSDGDAVRGHEIVARYPGALGNSIEVQICPGDADSDAVFNAWAYASEFDAAPGTSEYASSRNGSYDEVHVIVVDKLGLITGTAGTVLEKYPFVSVATDAKTADGSVNYVKKVINTRSDYIHLASFGSDLAFDSDEWGLSNAGSALPPGTPKTFTDSLSVKTFTLANGADPGSLTSTSYALAFDEIENTEEYDVDLLIAPGLSSQLSQKTVVNDLVTIAGTTRKDCVVVASPNRNSVVNNSESSIVTDVVACANAFTTSSYLFVDGNYLKVYDKYNDEYIWVPAASSTAGIMAASDFTNAPWYSPAGSRRGVYRNALDVYYSPEKTDRDTLYKASVNPIANFKGEGILLYGDKTKLGRPSAFNRINVRRLFLAIEKYISGYSKNILFEFNDEFTRSEFVGVVEPYLRSVQARRGIYDFRVVCDETNNTPEVIDNNEFIATIFVKPARSINFITLNFVAVRTGASFEEVAGAV